MTRHLRTAAAGLLLAAVAPSASRATTRELADLQPTRLFFGRSVLNELSYGTYRDPFDELQGRPYNLLFTNIGRHPNLSPWPGQEGSYTRFLNALIGNNGAANLDNDADAIQGALVRRETDAISWGLAAAVLAGNDGSKDANGISTFSDADDLTALDLRGGAAWQLSDMRVLGGGLRLTRAAREISDRSFEPGTGGFAGSSEFGQTALTLDAGLRQFHGPTSSWEVQAVLGWSTFEQDDVSETIDGTGVTTDRFVVANYDVTDLAIGIYGGWNRLNDDKLGELELRGGIERSQRELDNDDLSYSETGGVVTPLVTLLGQDAIATTRLVFSAKTIFQAGETEMFAGAELGWAKVEGATRIDTSGIPASEAVDDSRLGLGVTLGLRQPLFRDKLRFVVSGRADLVRDERGTIFDAASERDESTRSAAQYAIGLEGVLANVTFDLAWTLGEEEPVVPAPLGLPSGSRRSVRLDRLVFSAAVSW